MKGVFRGISLDLQPAHFLCSVDSVQTSKMVSLLYLLQLCSWQELPAVLIASCGPGRHRHL